MLVAELSVNLELRRHSVSSANETHYVLGA